MRLLRCLVSLLLVFVLSFALFLTSSYAMPVPDEWTYIENPERIPIEESYGVTTFASTEDTTYKLYYNTFARRASDGVYVSGTSYAGHWYNIPLDPVSYGSYNIRNHAWSEYLMSDAYYFKRSDNAIFGTEGMKLQLHIKDIANEIQQGTTSNNAVNSTPIYFDISRIKQMVVKLYDAKDNAYYQNLSPTDVITNGSANGLYNLILDIDSLPCDVRQVEIEFYYNTQYAFPGVNPSTYAYIYKNSGPGNASLNGGPETTIDMFCRTDTGGLLGNIIKIVTNIKDGITDLGSTVSSGLSNVVSSITQLPSKIWSFFEDGLKGLFIPTEEQMTEVKADWDNLLSDRFGGLYQSVQLIDDYASSFTNTESKNTIKVPELSVNLVGSTFTFGGQDVQIIPDKFSFLIDVIKTIISIIATTYFVNGLRNRFTREVIEGGTEQ